ncbi:hypothetical protein CEUSTIGMA_g7159.t1 [Chlamydomonas eustigma]|uniref:THO complex subunit 7 homolog n=1 Tax=Chlamydomonas eustigma TaxID=1157962 RepID=A0A250X9H4_9CHLO|nr:hypothetical protein CEUSTIGMA_g7159.t1 [Chlamydomonas eustigma]|eukprot:GAX79718.1 hypothetical protein CEUSTIGMA_g7159.t1 [Chlamydomonas eustigma]
MRISNTSYMSIKVSFTAAEEEAIIRARFLTGASVSRGAPPFQKLLKRFVELVDKVENGSKEASEDALKALLREITVIELQASKYQAIGVAQKKEQEIYVDKQRLLQEHIEQAKRDIEDKKKELQEARIVRQHMEEYEVLRGMICELPARSVTQAEIDRINKHMERIEAEGLKHAAIMEKKRKQYALLFHVLDELQRLPDDPDQLDTAVHAPESTDIATVGQNAMEVDT